MKNNNHKKMVFQDNIIKRGGSVHDAGEYLGHKERSTAGRYYTYMGKDHAVEIFKKYVA